MSEQTLDNNVDSNINLQLFERLCKDLQLSEEDKQKVLKSHMYNALVLELEEYFQKINKVNKKTRLKNLSHFTFDIDEGHETFDLFDRCHRITTKGKDKGKICGKISHHMMGPKQPDLHGFPLCYTHTNHIPTEKDLNLYNDKINQTFDRFEKNMEKIMMKHKKMFLKNRTKK